MSNITIESPITKLNIDNQITKKLLSNNILNIKDLWILKRKDLKQLGLNDQEIKHIIIKLQLHSIDLNKKIYNKN